MRRRRRCGRRARDMNIPLALQRGFGHVDMGVYAKVLTAGEITVGDRIVVRREEC